MALQIRKEGSTPNILKYSITADDEGGEAVVGREQLLKDSSPGPLRVWIERGVRLDTDEAACRHLLCNPSMRTFVTPQSLQRVAVDGVVDGPNKDCAVRVMAEAGARAILVLERRHSMAS